MIPVGSQPIAVAFDPANNDSYVANMGANYVSVIGTSGTVVQIIPTGPSPSSIAYDPANGVMYIASYSSGSLTLVGAANNSKIGAMPTGIGVTSIAFSPADGRVYVVNNASNTVTVIRATAAQSATIDVGGDPQQIAYNPSDMSIYVTSTGSLSVAGAATGAVQVIPSGASVVSKTLAVGTEPEGLGVDTKTGSVYVANCGSNSLSLVNSSGVTTLAPVDTGLGTCPTGVVYDPASDRLLVSAVDGTVTTINPNTNKAVATVSVSGSIHGSGSVNPSSNSVIIPVWDKGSVYVVKLLSFLATGEVNPGTGYGAYNPQNKEMYVTDPSGSGSGSNIWVWDALTGAKVNQITFSSNALPEGIVYNPSDHNMYVAVAGSGAGYVAVIDTNNDIVNKISTGSNTLWPEFVTYDSNDGNVYATVQKVTGFSQPGFVFAFNTSGNIVSKIAVGKVPTGIAYDSNTGIIYVADNIGGIVNLVDDSCACIVDNITVGGHPNLLAYDPKSTLVFMTDWYGGTVTALLGSAVDWTTSGVPGAQGVGADPSDGYVWVAAGSSTVLLDGVGLKVVTTLYNADYSYSSEVCQANGAAYNPEKGTMWMIAQQQGCDGVLIYTS